MGGKKIILSDEKKREVIKYYLEVKSVYTKTGKQFGIPAAKVKLIMDEYKSGKFKLKKSSSSSSSTSSEEVKVVEDVKEVEIKKKIKKEKSKSSSSEDIENMTISELREEIRLLRAYMNEQ